MATNNGDGISDKVKAEFAEEQAWELTEEEIEIVLKELEARLDEYVMEAALKFTHQDWNQHSNVLEFVEKLSPYMSHIEKRLRRVLPERYENNVSDPDGDIGLLRWKLPELGFIVGVIVGAKFSGASKEKMDALRSAAKDMVN